MMNNKKAEDYNSSILEEVLRETSSEVSQKVRNRMILAAKIDDAIKIKGWSKLEFAKKLDKHPSVISKWISGTHNFTADTLWDIERLLGETFINLNNSEKEQVIVYKVEIKSQNTENKSVDYTSLFIDSPVIHQTFEGGYDC